MRLSPKRSSVQCKPPNGIPNQYKSPNREFNQEVVMKRNQSKVVLAIIAAAVFALVTGCASMPSAEIAADELQLDLADSKP